MANSLLSSLRVYHYFNIMQINREFSKHILDDLSLIFRLLPITINSYLHTFDFELHIVLEVSVEIVMTSLIKIFETYGYQK